MQEKTKRVNLFYVFLNTYWSMFALIWKNTQYHHATFLLVCIENTIYWYITDLWFSRLFFKVKGIYICNLYICLNIYWLLCISSLNISFVTWSSRNTVDNNSNSQNGIHTPMYIGLCYLLADLQGQLIHNLHSCCWNKCYLCSISIHVL